MVSAPCIAGYIEWPRRQTIAQCSHNSHTGEMESGDTLQLPSAQATWNATIYNATCSVRLYILLSDLQEYPVKGTGRLLNFQL
jgi:hypothetical protein